MDDHQARSVRLARAWDEAARGYERYFVPRFAPWAALTVDALAERTLPPGPILVPCCGSFPELPALTPSHPQREIVGIDLSGGMLQLARERAAGFPRVRTMQGDVMQLDPQWARACAGVVSVFGLQQLPDPEAALVAWVSALRPGGCLSVMFWPNIVEQEGPFALVDRVLAEYRPPTDDTWETRLTGAVSAAGAIVERDELRSFPMRHPDAQSFWAAMTNGGPLRSLVISRGEEMIQNAGREFVRLAPVGPLQHWPTARQIVARRRTVPGEAPDSQTAMV